MKVLQAPTLNVLQKAWLQEIGLDRRMLAHYAVEPSAEPAAVNPPRQASGTHAPSDAQEGGPRRLAKAPTPGRTATAVALHAQDSLQRVSEILARPQLSSRQAADSPATATPTVRIEQDIPQDWEPLQAHVAQCQACGLHAGRSHAVFGTGATQSPEWMVIGVAPGTYDDRAGVPFQGKDGVLLQAMLASIGLADQAAVFFTNLIKCRPLGNRTPNADEIAACLPYLRRQIALLAPRRILALGGLAAQAILGKSDDLDALRGRVHTLQTEAGDVIPVVVTYHPAALLLRPQHKPDAWRDLNLALMLDGADAAASPRPD